MTYRRYLVGGAGDHIAAGGADVLDKGDHAQTLFFGELADAAEDQMRLHRRAARRVDNQRDSSRVAHGKRALQRAGDARQCQAGLQRRGEADDAGEAHNRHDRISPRSRRGKSA